MKTEDIVVLNEKGIVIINGLELFDAASDYIRHAGPGRFAVAQIYAIHDKNECVHYPCSICECVGDEDTGFICDDCKTKFSSN